MATATDNERLAEMDRLYDQYGKPFEDTHWGQYIVINKDGGTTIGVTMLEAMEKPLSAAATIYSR